MRKASGSTSLKLDASPLPTQSVPSGAERTVPIECEKPSDGMQSTVFDGAGHGPSWLPRIVMRPDTSFCGLTVIF